MKVRILNDEDVLSKTSRMYEYGCLIYAKIQVSNTFKVRVGEMLNFENTEMKVDLIEKEFIEDRFEVDENGFKNKSIKIRESEMYTTLTLKV